MKYRITHTTAYHYSEPASLFPERTLPHAAHHPQPAGGTQPAVLRARAPVSASPHRFLRQYRPCIHGPAAPCRTRHDRHQHRPDRLGRHSGCCGNSALGDRVQRLAAHRQPEELEASQFLFASPLITINPAILAYARLSFPPGIPVLAGVVDLTRRIFTEFTYDKSASTVDTSVAQVLASRRGVCQDFSHFAIACLRSLGLAARYVSGYLETLPPPGKPKMVGADASHAWVSVFVPEVGWIDFDPTNNMLVRRVPHNTCLGAGLQRCRPGQGRGHGRRRAHPIGGGGCSGVEVEKNKESELLAPVTRERLTANGKGAGLLCEGEKECYATTAKSAAVMAAWWRCRSRCRRRCRGKLRWRCYRGSRCWRPLLLQWLRSGNCPLILYQGTLNLGRSLTDMT